MLAEPAPRAGTDGGIRRRPPNRVRAWVRRHPMVTFAIWSFGIGWPVAALPALVDHHLLPGPTLPLPVVVLFVTYGVLLPAALTVTAIVGGRAGVRELLSRAVRARPGTWIWLTATLALPGVTVLLGAAAGASVTPDLTGVAAALVSAVTALLLIHLVEELVWAGFVQPRLGRRWGVLPAAALTAIPFAAIHLPLVLVGPVSARSVLTDAGGLLLLGLLLRVLIGALLARTGGSVLAAASVHAGFNAANNGGGVADRLLSGIDQGLLAPVAALLISAALFYAGRDRRGTRPGLLRPAPDPTHPVPERTDMPRSLILPAVVLGVALAAVAVAFLLDTGGPTSRDAALLIGTVALWAAAASALWLLTAVVLLIRSRRRPSRS